MPASFGGAQCQRRSQQQGEERHQNEAAGFEGAAELQRAESERGQIGAELGKNLGKDRQYLDRKDKDNQQHHAEHDKRIGDRAFEHRAEGILPLIIGGERSEHLVEPARLLPDFDHVHRVGGEAPRLPHRRGEGFPPFGRREKPVDQLAFGLALGVVP